ncbi:hypothetical protein SARC_01129 [Sphaeroforma arctica JP610]|uniref:inorganic diphosphatase n=1 Tax=Sphaeroforma arctica JP610 TaxID=667725 RepID=A0A0L0GCK7_9EUKA|nr:hypothetical protein SARC_01129 [Sphaeroforma arctica JP610]KNC86750.1 hypothetical protein SARC_01129 [Sphaeroforma arctica JP610]|eukprot:XP_014160652.1 hypothetical protein SARC_01129 [Sphaeroforma arctica JP610]
MKVTITWIFTAIAITSQACVKAASCRSLREEPKTLDDCFNEFKNPIAALDLDTFRENVKGCAWTGHLNTDTDSIAGAIGAADLFDGIAARSSEMNDESKWVLEQYNLTAPEYIGDFPDKSVCLVDVNQITQLPQDLDTNRIVGIVDHHALQSSTVVIDTPVRIDIRPVGSASTIVATYYGSANKPMSEVIAGVLMSAILSDTLNLNSPTTTELDKMMLTCLAKQSKTSDLDSYADAMFKAKANGFNNLDDDEVVRADTKEFDLCGNNVVWATVETTDPASMMARKEALAEAMKKLKIEKDAKYVFLSIVDIVNLNTDLILIGEDERELAIEAFKAQVNADEELVMNIGNLVSRKKDFIPTVQNAICGDEE